MLRPATLDTIELACARHNCGRRASVTHDEITYIRSKQKSHGEGGLAVFCMAGAGWLMGWTGGQLLVFCPDCAGTLLARYPHRTVDSGDA
jgi:hypothetical protein